MTQLIRGLWNICPRHRGGVITMGNFDGVHLGHQALIEKLKAKAHLLKTPSIVMIFEPQPQEFFTQMAGQLPVARLMRWREKWTALAAMGIDYIFLQKFNQMLADFSPIEFVEKILVQGLGVKHIIIGDDFRFGCRREGDFSFLEKMGKTHDFTVENMPSVIFNNERISSTRIRNLLAEGSHETAEQLLGHPYIMQGRVVHGDKLGRQLGFPTANIELHRTVTPVQGIYTVRMHGIDKNQALPGVANVGIRPTIGGMRCLLEVFLFDFDRDIYGRHVEVEFCQKLRDEVCFPNLDCLKKAIAKDAAAGREYFKLN